MMFAGLTSWMRYALNLRLNSDVDLVKVSEELDYTLRSRSFLCETSSVSLADIDVYFALHENFCFYYCDKPDFLDSRAFAEEEINNTSLSKIRLLIIQRKLVY